jgi:hypothetical protein
VVVAEGKAVPARTEESVTKLIAEKTTRFGLQRARRDARPIAVSERSDSACRSYSHDLGSIRELLAGRERELALATADLTALRAHVADLRTEQRLALDQMSERLLAVSGTADSAADGARAAKQAGQAASAELRALSEECAGVKEALLRLERRQVR